MENFENRNKNVRENKLNNSNGNLNSNNNQRDYDKEPLVVENKAEFYMAFFGFCIFVFMIYMYLYEPNETRFRQLFIIFPIFGLPFIFDVIRNRNKKYLIKLTNTRIINNLNKKPIKTIFLDEILYVKRAYFLRDRKRLKNQNIFYKFALKYDPYSTIIACLIICFAVFLILVTNFSMSNYQVVFILFVGIFSFWICKFLYFLIFKKEIRFIFYDYLVIYANEKNINFIIQSNNDYKLLREFFIKQKNIDIDKVECHIWLDDK